MEQTTALESSSNGRLKFLIGGLLIVAAIVYLIVSSTQRQCAILHDRSMNWQNKSGSVAGRDLRVSGAVIGDSIQYDPETLDLHFYVAHIPGDNNEIEAGGGLATVLHEAVNDPQPFPYDSDL